MFAIRCPFAIFGGALAAAALFLVLGNLVSVQFDIPTLAVANRIVFTPQIADTTPVDPRPEKATRELPLLPPSPPRGIGAGNGEGVTPVRYTPPTIAVPGGHGNRGLHGIDGDALPIVRVPPEYPPRAVAVGTEGWVQVQFSVTAAGTVRDAVVVASEPGTLFDEAALAAVVRWRYNPRVENGVAVERVGLQTVFRFELED